MPFGLTNSPATFQALMNGFFKPHLLKFVLIFFDDILVYSCTPELHMLTTVLDTLAQHQLYANRSKCELWKSEVAYLGHVIGANGVAVDQTKVQAMRDWPTPANLRELKGVLGLTGYYRKFVKGYASIALPLTNQLKRDSFGWSEEASRAFQALKEALATTPVLAMPNFALPFVRS